MPKIGSARRVIGEQLLKLRERSGESQIVALSIAAMMADASPGGCLRPDRQATN